MLTGEAPPESARHMVDLWRPWLEARAGQDLARLSEHVSDQDAYAQLVRQLLRDLEIADDDTAIRTVLSQTFSRAGYDVRVTANATTLWNWIARGDGHLVVTDVGDDNLDWSFGWTGTAQFVITREELYGSLAIEADNNLRADDAQPRSAPLVGGMVLALMTLPTIIIATRAALKAVPPSIREGALGIGASPVQVMTHHVLPLALPGMLTGTIIGMAQALGETAPLLMIGMVAFIVDIPGGPMDPSSVLPVQVYLWADSPERAFVERTSAAIIVLLSFLIAMNTFAVVMRRRFERRW